MADVWTRHGTHPFWIRSTPLNSPTDPSCHTYEWVVLDTQIRHGTRTNESWHTFAWVLAHIHFETNARLWIVRQTLRVTHMNASCQTHHWVMSHDATHPFGNRSNDGACAVVLSRRVIQKKRRVIQKKRKHARAAETSIRCFETDVTVLEGRSEPWLIDMWVMTYVLRYSLICVSGAQFWNTRHDIEGKSESCLIGMWVMTYVTHWYVNGARL